MTNFEKVKEEMRIKDFSGYEGLPCKIIHKLRKEENCGDRVCKECRQWLAEEYKEPVVLTEIERTILQNVNKEYKWLARDKNNNLHIHKRKPMKTSHFWDSGSTFGMNAFRHLFQFIKWEDSEPYEIVELLKEG